jgi:hypothetical protein
MFVPSVGKIYLLMYTVQRVFIWLISLMDGCCCSCRWESQTVSLNCSHCSSHRWYIVSLDSSASIECGYGLDDRAFEVWSPVEATNFSSNRCVQTGSGAKPHSCTMGTVALSRPVNRGRDVTLTTHPYLVPRSWMSRSSTSSPPQVPP